MKFIKSLLLITALLISGAGFAQAADDADCIGVSSQSSDLNLSSGNAILCVPGILANGDPIPPVKVLSCTITFKDGAGTELSVLNISGSPGSAHDVAVPNDGVGTTELFCTVDSQTSALSTANVTFPSSVAPMQPILIE